MSPEDQLTRVIEFLQNESMFSSVRTPVLEKLAALARTRRAPAGTNLYSMGQPCEELHFLMDGQARVVIVSKGGRERLLHSVLPGDMVGAVPFFDGKDYPCSLVTDVDSVFVAFRRDELRKFLVSEGEVSLAILGGLMTRMR